jgi:hypothetical protein
MNDEAEQAFSWPRSKPPAVYVWQSRSTLPRNVAQALTEIGLPVVHVRDPWAWPTRCDLYVQQTQLSNASRSAAALCHAEQIVMPQGHEYLVRRVRELSKLGDVYIFTPSKTGDNPIYQSMELTFDE